MIFKEKHTCPSGEFLNSIEIFGQEIWKDDTSDIDLVGILNVRMSCYPSGTIIGNPHEDFSEIQCK